MGSNPVLSTREIYSRVTFVDDREFSTVINEMYDLFGEESISVARRCNDNLVILLTRTPEIDAWVKLKWVNNPDVTIETLK